MQVRDFPWQQHRDGALPFLGASVPSLAVHVEDCFVIINDTITVALMLEELLSDHLAIRLTGHLAARDGDNALFKSNASIRIIASYE